MSSARTLQVLRIFPSEARQHDWTIELGPDGRTFAIANAPSTQWSRIDLPEVNPVQVLRLEVSRPEADDFVHLNELELYGPAAAPP